MVRVFFVEQLYRAFTILRNEPYHHEWVYETPVKPGNGYTQAISFLPTILPQRLFPTRTPPKNRKKRRAVRVNNMWKPLEDWSQLVKKNLLYPFCLQVSNSNLGSLPVLLMNFPTVVDGKPTRISPQYGNQGEMNGTFELDIILTLENALWVFQPSFFGFAFSPTLQPDKYVGSVYRLQSP